ncbi:transmembrane protein 68-like isoform X2 [Alligator sinensis]|uniref:Transmembrane protein 68-like isoform X2 n=1 Tax=Alligator sinensis TaxID=38654 RepID=A0A3Q0FTH8_ALLSI|nr:transmembrane protein 68-like isoform X2 [Alligator sinensis]
MVEMISRNESCTAGQIPMSYLTCLAYILEEWTGVEYIEDYLNYVAYLLWLFTPLIIVFLLPGIILLFLYFSIIFLYIYKRKKELKEAYSNDFWDGAKKMLAVIWYGHARIWHGFKLLLEVFGVMHGPQERCVKVLKNGNLVAISPGGVREALFSDETYVLMWGNRRGFAQVAIDAEAPIIPMFTQNVREGIRTLGRIKLFRRMYEYFRLPVVPLYGGFPVKYRTYIGDPIPYDPNLNAAELAEKAKNAIQSLIDKHQKIPGNIFRALRERFETQLKED